MATQTVRFSTLGRAPTGSFTVNVYSDGSLTAFASGVACSVSSVAGIYTFQLTSSSGLYRFIINDSGTSPTYAGEGWVRTTDTAATFDETENARVDIVATTPTAGQIRTEIEGAGTKLTEIHAKLPLRTYLLGTDVNSGAVASEDRAAIADAFYDDLLEEHLELGSFGYHFQQLATSTALAALVTTVGTAGAGLTEAGGTGDHLTAVPWNAAWDAEVQSEVSDAIIAAGLPRSGSTLRYTQIAANSGSQTADVSIGPAS